MVEAGKNHRAKDGIQKEQQSKQMISHALHAFWIFNTQLPVKTPKKNQLPNRIPKKKRNHCQYPVKSSPEHAENKSQKDNNRRNQMMAGMIDEQMNNEQQEEEKEEEEGRRRIATL